MPSRWTRNDALYASSGGVIDGAVTDTCAVVVKIGVFGPNVHVTGTATVEVPDVGPALAGAALAPSPATTLTIANTDRIDRRICPPLLVARAIRPKPGKS